MTPVGLPSRGLLALAIIGAALLWAATIGLGVLIWLVLSH